MDSQVMIEAACYLMPSRSAMLHKQLAKIARPSCEGVFKNGLLTASLLLRDQSRAKTSVFFIRGFKIDTLSSNTVNVL